MSQLDVTTLSRQTAMHRLVQVDDGAAVDVPLVPAGEVDALMICNRGESVEIRVVSHPASDGFISRFVLGKGCVLRLGKGDREFEPFRFRDTLLRFKRVPRSSNDDVRVEP